MATILELMPVEKALSNLLAAGSSEGARKAWESRQRGRKAEIKNWVDNSKKTWEKKPTPTLTRREAIKNWVDNSKKTWEKPARRGKPGGPNIKVGNLAPKKELEQRPDEEPGIDLPREFTELSYRFGPNQKVSAREFKEVLESHDTISRTNAGSVKEIADLIKKYAEGKSVSGKEVEQALEKLDRLEIDVIKEGLQKKVRHSEFKRKAMEELGQ